MTGKKLTLRFIAHLLVVRPLPPYVHLASTDVIYVAGVPRPSLFFTTFPLPCNRGGGTEGKRDDMGGSGSGRAKEGGSGRG